MKPKVKDFFDSATWTLTYVVYDETTKDGIIIDPVWDFDPASAMISNESAEKLIYFVNKEKIKIHAILETHAHADHITSSNYLKSFFPEAKVGIGAKITEVQKVFKGFFNLGDEFKTDGSQFDILLEEGTPLLAGSLKVETLFTPGHTPACGTFVIGDAVFTGDALFMPDSGTGRCDFPAGSSEDLYHSIHEKIYKLPDEYRVFVGHDYQPNGRALAFETTIAEEKKSNLQLKLETSKDEYVKFRNHRDSNLTAPKLLLPSVQLNIAAGKFPAPEDNGVSYLKTPIRRNI